MPSSYLTVWWARASWQGGKNGDQGKSPRKLHRPSLIFENINIVVFTHGYLQARMIKTAFETILLTGLGEGIKWAEALIKCSPLPPSIPPPPPQLYWYLPQTPPHPPCTPPDTPPKAPFGTPGAVHTTITGILATTTPRNEIAKMKIVGVRCVGNDRTQ